MKVELYKQFSQWLQLHRRKVIVILYIIMIVSSFYFYNRLLDNWEKFFGFLGTISSILGIILVMWQLDQIASNNEAIKTNTEHIVKISKYRNITRLIFKIRENLNTLLRAIETEKLFDAIFVLRYIRYDIKDLIQCCEFVNDDDININLSSLQTHHDSIVKIRNDLKGKTSFQGINIEELSQNIYNVSDDLEDLDLEVKNEGIIYE